MKSSYKIGLVFSAAMAAFCNSAFAADIAKGPYSAQGVITASSCGSLSASLKQGTASTASVEYPGAGVAGMVLASPETSSTGKAGSASTNVCVATAKVPSTGLNKANITFNCYADTVSGPASSAQAQLKSTFKVGASHSASIKQVTVTSTLYSGAIALCSFTTDATYALQ